MITSRLYYGKNPKHKISRLDLRIYHRTSRSSYFRIILIHRYRRKKISDVNKVIRRKETISALLITRKASKRERRTKTLLRDCPEIDFKLIYEKLKRNHSLTDSKDDLLKLIADDKDLCLF